LVSTFCTAEPVSVIVLTIFLTNTPSVHPVFVYIFPFPQCGLSVEPVFSSDCHQKLPLINLEQEAMAQKLHIGICGAGIGGLAAAIAMAKAGAKVTVLEAAPELGEIGAGIQMTPNVARLLVDWGVDQVIGDNLSSLKS
jgi:hypothetical protein